MFSSLSVGFMLLKDVEHCISNKMKKKNLQMMSKCFIKDKFRFCMRCDILCDLSTLL